MSHTNVQDMKPGGLNPLKAVGMLAAALKEKHQAKRVTITIELDDGNSLNYEAK